MSSAIPFNPLNKTTELTSTKLHDDSNDITEHKLSHEEIAELLKVDFKTGLTEAEAEKRLEENGPNALTPPKRTPLWLKFLHHLVGGFAILLWVGSLLCFIVFIIDGGVENLTLGIVLAAVVMITGVFSFYQEFKSDGIMAGFLKLAATECDVYREGKYRSSLPRLRSSSQRLRRIPANDLVIGDVVRLEKGFKIPADVIILESNGIKVDNSSLTGESELQKRGPVMTDEAPHRTRSPLLQ
jgi:sodium/potassium-transporting ATPase subunit alpha